MEEWARRPVPDGGAIAMESFFAQLQKNVLDRKRRDTRNELRQAIVAWPERTYRLPHRESRLGRSTPVESENICAAASEPLTRVSTELAAAPNTTRWHSGGTAMTSHHASASLSRHWWAVMGPPLAELWARIFAGFETAIGRCDVAG